MQRPKTYTIAAVLLFVYSLIGIAFEIPNLMLGTAASSQYESGGGPPFLLVLINFAIGAMGLVSAYGVWKMQKWGIVLSIILMAISTLTTIPAVLFAPLPFKIAGGVSMVWSIAIIILLLRPQPHTEQAASQVR